MARLYRPHIPLKVRVKVADRQLRAFPDHSAIVETVKESADTWSEQLHHLLLYLARALGCEVSELRLDHDPPLALRPQERRGLSKKVFYTPDANDPDHLFYRPHGAQYEGSHDVKTRIRGDHGQYSDIVLIKRQRRRDKAAAALNETVKKNRQKMRSAPAHNGKHKPKSKWANRPFPKGRGFQKGRVR